MRYERRRTTQYSFGWDQRLTEDAEQKLLRQWAALHSYSSYLIHIPNGGYRNTREASKLKSMGVTAGVSDLFLAVPVKRYGGALD